MSVIGIGLLFNIADVSICLGAGLIIIESFFPDKNASPQEANKQK